MIIGANLPLTRKFAPALRLGSPGTACRVTLAMFADAALYSSNQCDNRDFTRNLRPVSAYPGYSSSQSHWRDATLAGETKRRGFGLCEDMGPTR